MVSLVIFSAGLCLSYLISCPWRMAYVAAIACQLQATCKAFSRCHAHTLSAACSCAPNSHPIALQLLALGALGENGLPDFLRSRRQLKAATAALIASNIEGNDDDDDDDDSEEKDRERNIAIIVAAVAFAVLLAACALSAWLRTRRRRRAAASYGVRTGGKPADSAVPQYAPNNKVAEYGGGLRRTGWQQGAQGRCVIVSVGAFYSGSASYARTRGEQRRSLITSSSIMPTVACLWPVRHAQRGMRATQPHALRSARWSLLVITPCDCTPDTREHLQCGKVTGGRQVGVCYKSLSGGAF